jgi:membrane protein implicated in regulation of membrane protease activity
MLIESFTVTFVDWNGTFLHAQQVLKNGSATAPADPRRSGHRFIGWDTSYINVISDITVTALYSQNATPPPPVVPPIVRPPVVPPLIVDPVVPEVEPPEPYVPPKVEPVIPEPQAEPPAPAPVKAAEIDPLPIAEESPHQATLDRLANAGVPIMNIGGQEVPLAALPGMSAWALLNLILSLLGIVFAVVTVLRARDKKIRDAEGFDYNAEGEEKQSLRRHIWLIPVIIFAVFGFAFFMVTENMNNLMVLLWDQWTIINIIAFAAVVVTTKLALKQDGDDEQEPALSQGA